MIFTKSQVEVLSEINKTLNEVQNTDFDKLMSRETNKFQFEISRYLPNLNQFIYSKNREFVTKDLFAEHCEDEFYINNRDVKEQSIQDSKINARLEAYNAIVEARKSEVELFYLKGLYKSIEAVITSCQVHRKQMEKEEKEQQPF